MEYRYDINGKDIILHVDTVGDKLKVTFDDRTYIVTAAPSGDGSLLLMVDGHSYPVRFARDSQGLHVMVKGIGILAKEPSEEGAGGSGDLFELVDGKQILVAPMPGQVVKVNVNVGDAVKKNQCCVIVEAMKMENELNTAVDGTITAVHVEAGQQVNALQPLVEITQADEN